MREIRALEQHIAALEREFQALADADPVTTRLRDIPGINLLTATALVGTVTSTSDVCSHTVPARYCARPVVG
jgi:transposase